MQSASSDNDACVPSSKVSMPFFTFGAGSREQSQSSQKVDHVSPPTAISTLGGRKRPRKFRLRLSPRLRIQAAASNGSEACAALSTPGPTDLQIASVLNGAYPDVFHGDAPVDLLSRVARTLAALVDESTDKRQLFSKALTVPDCTPDEGLLAMAEHSADKQMPGLDSICSFCQSTWKHCEESTIRLYIVVLASEIKAIQNADTEGAALPTCPPRGSLPAAWSKALDSLRPLCAPVDAASLQALELLTELQQKFNLLALIAADCFTAKDSIASCKASLKLLSLRRASQRSAAVAAALLQEEEAEKRALLQKQAASKQKCKAKKKHREACPPAAEDWQAGGSQLPPAETVTNAARSDCADVPAEASPQCEEVEAAWQPASPAASFQPAAESSLAEAKQAAKEDSQISGSLLGKTSSSSSSVASRNSVPDQTSVWGATHAGGSLRSPQPRQQPERPQDPAARADDILSRAQGANNASALADAVHAAAKCLASVDAAEPRLPKVMLSISGSMLTGLIANDI